MESFVRLLKVMAHNRPIGSFLGTAGYSIWFLLRKDKTGLIDPLPRYDVARAAPPPGVALADRYRVTEAFLVALVRPFARILLEGPPPGPSTPG